MNKLEAQTIIENTGNYEEEEIEEILGVYETILKHVGFKDERRDQRFIVKFHDIFYYMPEEYENDNRDEFDHLFEEFCEQQYSFIVEEANEKNIDIDEMLHPMCVGNYQPFIVDIPEITMENAIDVAMKVYDEFNWRGKEYVENYIYLVGLLKDLEDNYVKYWIEFLEDAEYSPKKLNEIKEKYNRDRERKN